MSNQIEPYLKLYSIGIQAGGIFVDASARQYLTDTLGKAAVDSEALEEYVNTGVEEFESRTKRLFKDFLKPTPIKIADRLFSDADAGVLRGRISISGFVWVLIYPVTTLSSFCYSEAMKRFHDGSVNDILSALEDQLSGLSAKVWSRIASLQYSHLKIDIAYPPSRGLRRKPLPAGMYQE